MRKNLSHDSLTVSPLHLTYRLAGSLPRSVTHRIQYQLDEAMLELDRSTQNLPAAQRAAERKERKHIKVKKYEYLIEEALHKVNKGPMHLSNPAIAKLVLQSWRDVHRTDRSYVYAACVMSNHVHVVLRSSENEPEVDLGKLIKSHKNYTARAANKILAKTGHSFWADSYFDRRIRTGKFMTVMWYVLNNPVKAGLVNIWEEWENTWVNPEWKTLFLNKE